MASDISPAVVCQFKHGCKNFFIHNKAEHKSG
jgi:hypothetical protein